MRKDQVDLVNATIWIPDSTPERYCRNSSDPSGDRSHQKPDTGLWEPGPTLFLQATKIRLVTTSNVKTAWRKTLKRAGVPYFRIYDLRSTYATRLSAGGVADEWVTQLLRQGDAKVFKKYSQMKLQMKREALEKMNRQANEMPLDSGTATIQ